MAPAKAAKADSAPASTTTDAVRRVHESIDHLVAVQHAIKATIDAGHASPATARESANIARGLATLSAELRQIEKHEREAFASLPDAEADALIVAHVLSLPIERRAVILAQLAAASTNGSVL